MITINKIVANSIVITTEPVDDGKTRVKYTASSGIQDWEGDIVGELTQSSIPNKSDIAEVEIGSHVTSIGDQAFYNCTSLTSISLPTVFNSLPASWTVEGKHDATTVFSAGQYVYNPSTGVWDYDNGRYSATRLIRQKQGAPDVFQLVQDPLTENYVMGEFRYSPEQDVSIRSSTDIVATVRITAPTPESLPVATTIGNYAFAGCSSLTSVTFTDKDKATVQGMSNYSWGLPSGCIIHCTDGDITL